MIEYKQIKRYLIGVLYPLMGLLIVACTQTTPATNETTATTQQVEYGASLDEWESSQAASREETATTSTTAVVPPAATKDVAANASLMSEEASLMSEEDVAALQEDNSNDQANLPLTLVKIGDKTYRELLWEDLVPENFTAAAIMSKYEDELAKFDDGDPEALTLYMQMQREFNNAPVNELLNEVNIKLPGFITPLEYTDDLITEFLLVPYFGACIHVPAPPANQTVLVKTAEGQGIRAEDAYNPIWVLGTLITEEATTELADAGYYVQDALIEPYTFTP